MSVPHGAVACYTRVYLNLGSVNMSALDQANGSFTFEIIVSKHENTSV